MAVVIRLKRTGRRHRPFYRIEAMDRRTRRDGRCLENIGYYDPFATDEARRVRIKLDRLQYWVNRGAQPSHTVTTFLRPLEIKWGNPARKSRKALLRKRRAARKQGAQN